MNRTAILAAYIDEVALKPFAFGVNDCLLMVAGAVERLTGVDHAAPYRGRYRTLRGARRILGMPPIDFVRRIFEERAHPARAMDGDIAAFQQDGEWCFGIFIGAHVYVQTENGIGIRDRSDASRAFKVT